ncbi:hypothetical protein K470DRAFT_260223 [Piedraia hortae CBS 480.64]|uniref:Uncharacterized protein n=1 Tax=Piedraia hortae CBS 480.64 TaxID=1314780 RepID=A0A6A7BS00_9PEZI|nr:hypothetical protein K470DRAFT_260223 [Piedraia hortae CBS 480.64]
MSDEQLSTRNDQLCIEIFQRGIAINNYNFLHFGPKLFHWAILLRPKPDVHLDKSLAIDVDNGPWTTSDGTREPNETKIWNFRTRRPVDPLKSKSFHAAVAIGKLPPGTGEDDVVEILRHIPLPRPGNFDDSNCHTWLMLAIEKLQAEKVVSKACSAGEIIEMVTREGLRLQSDEAERNAQQRFLIHPKLYS